MKQALIAIVAVLIPGVSWAQVCTGQAPIGRSSPGIFGAGVSFAEGIASYGFSIGGGTDAAFGRGGFAVNHYDEDEFDTWAVGAVGGSQIAADASRRIQICPVGQFTYEWRNDIQGSGVDLSALTTGAGVLAGFVAAESASAQLVPTVGLAVNRTTVKISVEDFGSERVSRTYGVAQLGLGIILNRRSAITPSVAIPFGIDDVEPSFSLVFSYAFGGR